MDSVIVTKDDLRKQVQANRDQHRKIFEEAVEGYRKQAVKILEDHIALIKKGKVTQVRVSLPVPEDHTDDYDRILKMLDMSISDEIEIDEHHFTQYVMDDWAWKQQFLTSSANYSQLASRALKK